MSDLALDRLEQVTAKLERLAATLAAGEGSGASDGDEEKEAPSVAAWNAYYTAVVTPFCESAKKLKLDKIVELCSKSWTNVGDLVLAASTSKKPSPAELQKFIKPAADSIGAAQGLPDKRKDDFFHHSAFGELIAALGWVMISPTPQGHIQGQLESADFFLSKVLFNCKSSTDKADHRAFVKNGKALLTEMKVYVKQWHTTGVVYKGKGSISDPPKAKAGGPPAAGAPPPLAAGAVPIPKAGAAAAANSGKSGGGGGMGAVLSDLQQGDAITSGLKKVTSSMKTKNRSKDDRSGLVQSQVRKSGSGDSKWSAKKEVSRPPSITLARGQHMIQYHNEGDIRVPEGATIKQSVYIFRCGQCIVRVPEKVKAVVLDGCRKTRIVVDSVVSTVEVVNCTSVIVAITGVVNSIAVDKTNGCQLWIPKESADHVEIITSCVSEVNVQVPGNNPDDDPIEIPVPEQFKTVIKGVGSKSKLETFPVKHG